MGKAEVLVRWKMGGMLLDEDGRYQTRAKGDEDFVSEKLARSLIMTGRAERVVREAAPESGLFEPEKQPTGMYKPARRFCDVDMEEEEGEEDELDDFTVS